MRGRSYRTAAEAIESNIAVSDSGCWQWTGATERNGYARVNFNGKRYYIHRLAYESYIGPVPDGLEVDHVCRNRACCNPDHLEAITHRENMLRGDTTARAHHEGRHCGVPTCCICLRTRKFREDAASGSGSAA